jgi:hypothetical protein
VTFGYFLKVDRPGLGEDPPHHVRVQAQLVGDGPNTPLLGVVESEDLRLLFG